MIKNKCLISKRLVSDGVPGFRLNFTRHAYKNKLLAYFNDSRLGVENCSICPCGSVSLSIIAEKERFGLPFKSLVCGQCGLVILDPQIKEESLTLYYKDIYHPLICSMSSGKIQSDLVRKDQGQYIYNFIKGNIAKKEIKVCEIGCAGGDNLVDFSRLAAGDGIRCNLYGSEFEEHYAAYAKNRGINITTESLSSLVKFGVKFDLIILSHVLEHFSKPKEELGTISTFLSDDGLLYVEVPGIMNLQDYNNDFLDYLVHAHNYSFNLDALKNLLRICGFHLQIGNEKVQALFKKGGNDSGNKINNNSQKIISYLKHKEGEFVKGIPALNRIKRCLWMLFYRIEYILFLSGVMKRCAAFYSYDKN